MAFEYAIRRARLTPEGAVFSGDKTEAVVLNEMASRGFRYVGYHPEDVIGFGRVNTICLIFERYKEE